MSNQTEQILLLKRITRNYLPLTPHIVLGFELWALPLLHRYSTT
jgi:hypothetical protein